MDTYDRELISVFFFQSPQLRKNMSEIDSTISPEVQNDDPTSEFLHG